MTDTPLRCRRRILTADETRIWQAVTHDVVPMGPRVAEPVVDAPLPVIIPPPSPPAARAVAPGRPVAPASRPVAPLPLHHGRSPGVDGRTAERLKRGELVIDGRIDLHGMTQDAAHGALQAVVLRAYDHGRRCLLVITGKGRDGGGILRAQVPRWLNQAPLRERVLGFSYARPHHGGEGALYVLIKRHRSVAPD